MGWEEEAGTWWVLEPEPPGRRRERSRWAAGTPSSRSRARSQRGREVGGVEGIPLTFFGTLGPGSNPKRSMDYSEQVNQGVTKSMAEGIALGKHGQYRLGKHLRSYGGILEVFEAEQKLLDRPVEVHILRPSKRANPSLFRRVLSIMEAAQEISHPALLPILDVDGAKSRAFFTTPRRDSMPLAQLVREAGGHLEPRKAVDAILAITRGLSALHEGGLLLQELGSTSIFMGEEGSSAYLAELPLGEPDTIIPPSRRAPMKFLAGQMQDERSDVFLVGTLLLRIVAGKLKLNESPDPQTGSWLQPVHETLRGRSLPAGLQDILEQATQHSPEARIESMQELGDLLEEVRLNPPERVKAPERRFSKNEIKDEIRRKMKEIQRKEQVVQGEWKSPATAAEEEEQKRARRRLPWLIGGIFLALGSTVYLSQTSATATPQRVELSEETSSGPQGLARNSRPAKPLPEVREDFQTMFFQTQTRPTTTNSFLERWDRLRSALTLPEVQASKHLGISELYQLRLRYLKGDPKALEILDRWIREHESLLKPGAPAKPPEK